MTLQTHTHVHTPVSAYISIHRYPPLFYCLRFSNTTNRTYTPTLRGSLKQYTRFSRVQEKEIVSRQCTIRRRLHIAYGEAEMVRQNDEEWEKTLEVRINKLIKKICTCRERYTVANIQWKSKLTWKKEEPRREEGGARRW